MKKISSALRKKFEKEWKADLKKKYPEEIIQGRGESPLWSSLRHSTGQHITLYDRKK